MSNNFPHPVPPIPEREQARPAIPNGRSTPVVNLLAGALSALLSMFAVPDGLRFAGAQPNGNSRRDFRADANSGDFCQRPGEETIDRRLRGRGTSLAGAQSFRQHTL